MDQNHKALLQEFAVVSESFSALSKELHEAAKQMAGSGLPPPESLIEALLSCRSKFTRARANAIQFAASISASLVSSPDAINSLKALRALVREAADVAAKRADEEQVRHRALAILDRIISLTHRDNLNFPPLVECLAKARETRRAILKETLQDLHPEAKRLAEAQHPFCNLLMLVEQGEALDDQQWTRLVDSVEQVFGKPLSVAAQRRKLVFCAEPRPGASSLPVAETESLRPATETIASEVQAVVPESSAEPPPAASSEVLEPLIELGKDADASSISDEPRASQPTPTPITIANTLRLEAAPTVAAHTDTPTAGPVAPSRKSEGQQPDHGIEPPGLTSAIDGAPVKTVAEQQRQTEESAFAPEQTRSVLSATQAPEAEPTLCLFEADVSAQKIATAILSRAVQDRPAALRDLIWRLIYEDRMGLAFHLARAVEILNPEFQPMIPAWIIRAAAIGASVRYSTGEIAHLLENDFQRFNQNCFDLENGEWNHAIRFMLAAATLRAALLAPDTGASDILHSLKMKEGLDQLYEYCKTIAEFGDQLQPLDPNAVKQVKTLAVWETESAALHQQVEAWCAEAPRWNFVFHGASRVWRKWLEPQGIIHALLEPVRQNEARRLTVVTQGVEELSDAAQIRREANNTARQMPELRRNPNIIGTALKQLHNRVHEALDLARSWMALQQSRPGHNSGFHNEQAERLRHEIQSCQATVMQQLVAFAKANPSLLIAGAAACCRKALRNIELLFDPNAPLSSEEPNWKFILHADLLRIPTLVMNDQWEPEPADPQRIIDGILELVAADSLDWKQAFEARAAVRDHEATDRIIAYRKAAQDHSLNLSELERQRETGLRDCQDALRKDIEETRRCVSEGIAFGLLTEKEQVFFEAEVGLIELGVEETRRFRVWHDQLDTFRQQIDEKRGQEVERVRQRLAGADVCAHIKPGQPDYERILGALNNGDVLTATDYIDLALAGQPLPEPEEERDRLRDFFPEKAQALGDFIEQTKTNEIVRLVKARENICGMDLQALGSEQEGRAAQAADMLETWFTARDTQAIHAPGARTLLTHLGFTPFKLTVNKAPYGKRAWIETETAPVQNRELCPVATYGSVANGRYRILCVWDKPLEEDLLDEVSDPLHPDGPMLVFYFGRLTEPRRRALARACRDKNQPKTCIVIDDALMLYLCSVPGSRLPVLFECALPFTFIEPYTTTPGVLSPEMFYGRQREQASIQNPMGTCFIYGGRQLGKTVLLRKIEREFHNPDRGIVALWLDIKHVGFPFTSPDELSTRLITAFKALKSAEIFKTKVPDHTGLHGLLGHLQTWLEEDSRRRILLLLDEADNFLESDAKDEFVRTGHLKELMDKTNRRFKVVFAGLHNVQRTTYLENNPLAHYGDPLCIGPLLNYDSGEARRLVEQPMVKAGYRFESPNVINQILSLTNYYPSLIQLYCSELLRYLNTAQARLKPKTIPPITITNRHVRDAYQAQDLWQGMSKRLKLTLDQDTRYRVIAYAIAYDSHLQSGRELHHGFPVSWIREQAVYWWPQGFQNTSEDKFRALLDEMVGLGVLRKVDSGDYALRSHNVARLFGAQEEIEAEIEASIEREASAPYDQTTFRTAYRAEGQIDPTRRSPLTYRQESELRAPANGVSVICGSAAAGLHELEAFLLAVFGEEYFIAINDVAEVAGFAARLDALGKRERDGTTLVLVSPLCAWSRSWIDVALQRVSRLTSKTSFVRVAFIADPRVTWELLGENPQAVAALRAKQVTVASLRPWHGTALQQWLEDWNFTISRPAKDGFTMSEREQIAAATGQWPALLRVFYERVSQNPAAWEQGLAELGASFDSPETANQMADLWGLDIQEPRQILCDLMDLSGATLEDLIGVAESLTPELVERGIRWADLLGLASPIGQERWQIDPLVGRVLQTARK